MRVYSRPGGIGKVRRERFSRKGAKIAKVRPLVVGMKITRPSTLQVPVPIECRGVRFDEGFRADIIVGNKVIIELKSVEKVINAHKKQVLTYLKLTGMRLGYLLNFGEAMMRRGITRTVNGLFE